MGGVTCLLLLLWAGVTVGTVLDLQKRIYGGGKCGKTERLHHVELFVTRPLKDPLYCGGTLLKNQWILTAAHCWEEGCKIRAELGVHPGPKQPDKIIERHEIFMGPNKQEHDIMLLKLPNPPNIEPASLPVCGTHPPLGEIVQMAGHGSTDCRYNERSDTLQCAYTTVGKCDRDLIVDKHNNVFCGIKAGVAACQADSGSGVMYKDKIYGVISTGVGTDKGSQVEFMDVCNKDYMQWINQIIAT